MVTVDSFIRDLEAYYSDTYAKEARAIMAGYLAKRDKDGILPYLHAQVFKTYERTGGRIAPGVAELEKCKAEAWAKRRSVESAKSALAAPDRLQIAEDVLDPQAVAQVLARLAAGKKVDSPGETG